MTKTEIIKAFEDFVSSSECDFETLEALESVTTKSRKLIDQYVVKCALNKTHVRCELTHQKRDYSSKVDRVRAARETLSFWVPYNPELGYGGFAFVAGTRVTMSVSQALALVTAFDEEEK